MGIRLRRAASVAMAESVAVMLLLPSLLAAEDQKADGPMVLKSGKYELHIAPQHAWTPCLVR
jgi:hypothetical protein